MQKHAFSYEKNYQTIYAPLPIDADEVLYFDRKPVGLPYTEDFPMLHYHDRYEIGVCESGEGLFLSEGLFYSVSKGDFIFVAPEQCHYSRSLSPEKTCICRFSYLHAETVERLIALALAKSEAGETTYRGMENPIPCVIRASEYPQATAWLSKLMDVCKQDAPNGAAVAILALSIFLLEAQNIFWDIRSIPTPSHREDDAVTSISKYLLLHYDRSDTACELADKCHLSESQLRRRFIAIYGMPPIAYRNFLRCKIAAELLRRSPMAVSDIAERVGYTAASDLYRAFKKMYGISPAAYRSNNRTSTTS